MQRYNESGIVSPNLSITKEKIVYTSNLRRSIATGDEIGEKINITSLLREAEIPLIEFPPVNLKVNLWLFTARILWLAGVNKDCESFSGAKSRAKQLARMFKSLGRNEQRIVAAGHGFINRLVKKELLRSGWKLKAIPANHSFLSRMIFEIDY